MTVGGDSIGVCEYESKTEWEYDSMGIIIVTVDDRMTV